ncbi:MICAL-like protein 2 [Frankliniella fusca]|uniref:MICAL-like protein 2 n=1 Tax=Frankliniella fusca TaxID=407009 RepID=A0AAE1L954_9NEOP|nr:MICAL-like protein 2 [Frankliniella fusca]
MAFKSVQIGQTEVVPAHFASSLLVSSQHFVGTPSPDAAGTGQQVGSKMGEKRGTKALEVWCRRVTEGYPGVKVENMTTSWRDGLAFCALIHHFRPDLIDFDSLDKRDVYRNNELAFRIAERHLGIPALLDAEDMVEYEVPDRLSMLTYLSQFYQTFVGQQGHSPNSRTPVKRSSVSPSLSSSPDLSPNMSPTSTSPPSKVAARGVHGGASSRSAHDSCTHCGLPVFLAERLLVGSKRALYHRTCFRCARCSAQLTLANCYETEDAGFCCETCPDEEMDKSDTSSLSTDRVDFSDSKSESMCSAEVEQKTLLRNLSISDDEKSSESQPEQAGVAAHVSDDYSALFESTIENFDRGKSAARFHTGKSPLAIKNQVSNDLVSKADDLDKSLPIPYVHSGEAATEQTLHLENDDELSLGQSTKEDPKSFDKVEELKAMSGSNEDNIDEKKFNTEDSVHNFSKNSEFRINQSCVSVSSDLSGVNNCTKDSKISSADTSVTSIVKIRKMMFENESTSPTQGGTTPQKTINMTVSISKTKDTISSQIKESETGTGHKTGYVAESDDTEKGLQKQKDFNLVSENVKLREPCNVVDVNVEMKNPDQPASFCETSNKNESSECNVFMESETVVQDFVKENDDVMDISDLANTTKPSVRPRKIITAPAEVEETRKGSMDYPQELNPFGDEENQEEESVSATSSFNVNKKESTNPFGSSEEEEEEPVVLRKKSGTHKPPRPPPPNVRKPLYDSPSSVKAPSVSPTPAQRKVIPAPANLNPFWSDGEEPEDDSASIPVPLPRTIRLTPEPSPSPRPRTTVAPNPRMLNSTGKFGSSSSLSSMTSNTGTNRRSKKPAPAPPSLSGAPSRNSSQPPSPSLSIRSPHKRKSRPAPQPPSLQSTCQSDGSSSKFTSLDGQKMQKDEANRSTQAVGKEESTVPRDKSTYGQWKRKKGPAPPRPMPQRRQVRAMPLKELRRELDDIEVKQLELERQGVKLEQTIRLKFDEAPPLNESTMTPDVEDLVIQLFELVNEKNELFRKQAELMYLRRQQRLEEEHAELEYEIRCLMEQPERNKTDIMKAREEELIQRLVEVVERRNEIIECLEMDRKREAEEDKSIHSRLGLFAAKSGKDSGETTPKKIMKEKKKKKEKDSKKKKDVKVDADKDIDEVEAAAFAAAKEKKSKRKWF